MNPVPPNTVMAGLLGFCIYQCRRYHQRSPEADSNEIRGRVDGAAMRRNRHGRFCFRPAMPLGSRTLWPTASRDRPSTFTERISIDAGANLRARAALQAVLQDTSLEKAQAPGVHD